MPLFTDEVWTFRCGVCELTTETRPGTYPEGWRRLTIGRRMDAHLSGLDHERWRAARIEDWLCSPGCAIAAIGRSWDPPRERQLRNLELAAVASRVVA